MSGLPSTESARTEDAKETVLEDFLKWYEENHLYIMDYFNHLPSHTADEKRKILERNLTLIRLNLDWIRKYRKIEEIETAINLSEEVSAISEEFVNELKNRSSMHSSE